MNKLKFRSFFSLKNYFWLSFKNFISKTGDSDVFSPTKFSVASMKVDKAENNS